MSSSLRRQNAQWTSVSPTTVQEDDHHRLATSSTCCTSLFACCCCSEDEDEIDGRRRRRTSSSLRRAGGTDAAGANRSNIVAESSALLTLLNVGDESPGQQVQWVENALPTVPPMSTRASNGAAGALATTGGGVAYSRATVGTSFQESHAQGGAVLTTAAHLAISLHDARRLRLPAPSGTGGGGGGSHSTANAHHHLHVHQSFAETLRHTATGGGLFSHEATAQTEMESPHTATTAGGRGGAEHGHMLHELRNKDREADRLLTKKLARERPYFFLSSVTTLFNLKFASTVTEREYVVYAYSSHRIVALGYCVFAVIAVVVGSVLLYRTVFRAGFGVLAIVVLPWIVAAIGIWRCRKAHLKQVRAQRERTQLANSERRRTENGAGDMSSSSDEDEEAQFTNTRNERNATSKRKQRVREEAARAAEHRRKSGTRYARRRVSSQIESGDNDQGDTVDVEQRDAWSLETQKKKKSEQGFVLKAEQQHQIRQFAQQRLLYDLSRTALRDNAMLHEALLLLVTIANFIFMFLLHGSKNDCHYIPSNRILMDCQAATQNEGITLAVFIANVFLTPIRAARYFVLATMAYIGYGIYFYQTSNRLDDATFSTYYISEMIVLGTHLLSTIILMFVYERWRRSSFEAFVRRHQRALMVELVKSEAQRVVNAAIPMGSVKEALDQINDRRRKAKRQRQRERQKLQRAIDAETNNNHVDDATARSHRQLMHKLLREQRGTTIVHADTALFGYHNQTLVCILSLEGFASWSSARGPCSTVQLLHPLTELLDDLREAMLASLRLEKFVEALQARRRQQDEVALASQSRRSSGGGVAGGGSAASRLSVTSFAEGGGPADLSADSTSTVAARRSTKEHTTMIKYHGLGDDYVFTITDLYAFNAAKRAAKIAAKQRPQTQQQHPPQASVRRSGSSSGGYTVPVPPAGGGGLQSGGGFSAVDVFALVLIDSTGDDRTFFSSGNRQLSSTTAGGGGGGGGLLLGTSNVPLVGVAQGLSSSVAGHLPRLSPSSPARGGGTAAAPSVNVATSLAPLQQHYGPRGEVAAILFDFALAACSLVNIGILELEGVVLDQHPLCTMPNATDRERSKSYRQRGDHVVAEGDEVVSEPRNQKRVLRYVEPLRMRAALDVGPCGGVVLSSTTRRRDRKIEHQGTTHRVPRNYHNHESTSSSFSSGGSNNNKDDDDSDDDSDYDVNKDSSSKSAYEDEGEGISGFRSWSAVGSAVDVCATGVSTPVVGAENKGSAAASSTVTHEVVRQNTKFLMALGNKSTSMQGNDGEDGSQPRTTSATLVLTPPSAALPSNDRSRKRGHRRDESTLPNTIADEDQKKSERAGQQHATANPSSPVHPFTNIEEESSNGALLPAVFMSDRFFDLIAEWLPEISHDGILDSCFATTPQQQQTNSTVQTQQQAHPPMFSWQHPGGAPSNRPTHPTMPPLTQTQHFQRLHQQHTASGASSSSAVPPQAPAVASTSTLPYEASPQIPTHGNVFEYLFPLNLYGVVQKLVRAMVDVSASSDTTAHGADGTTYPWRRGGDKKKSSTTSTRTGGGRNPFHPPSMTNDVMDNMTIIPTTGRVLVGVVDHGKILVLDGGCSGSTGRRRSEDSSRHHSAESELMGRKNSSCDDLRPTLQQRTYRKDALAMQMQQRLQQQQSTNQFRRNSRQSSGLGFQSLPSGDVISSSSQRPLGYHQHPGSSIGGGESPQHGASSGIGAPPLANLVLPVDRASPGTAGTTTTTTTTTTTNTANNTTASSTDIYDGFYESTPNDGQLPSGVVVLPALQRSLNSVVTHLRRDSAPLMSNASTAGANNVLPLLRIDSDVVPSVDPLLSPAGTNAIAAAAAAAAAGTNANGPPSTAVMRSPRLPQMPMLTNSTAATRPTSNNMRWTSRHQKTHHHQEEKSQEQQRQMEDENNPNVRYHIQIQSLRLHASSFRLFNVLFPPRFTDPSTELHYMIAVFVDFESPQRRVVMLLISGIALLYVLAAVVIAAVDGMFSHRPLDDGNRPVRDTSALWIIITCIACVAQVAAAYLPGADFTKVKRLVKTHMAKAEMEKWIKQEAAGITTPLSPIDKDDVDLLIARHRRFPFDEIVREVKLTSRRMLASSLFSIFTIASYTTLLFVAEPGTYMGDSQIVWFFIVLSMCLQRPPVFRPLLMWLVFDVPVCAAFFVRSFRNIDMYASLRNTSLFINILAMIYCWMIRTLNDEAQRKTYRSDRRAAFVDEELTLQKKELLTALRLVAPQGAAIRLLRRAVLHNGFRGYAGLAAAGDHVAALTLIRRSHETRQEGARREGGEALATQESKGKFGLLPNAIRMERFVSFVEDMLLGTKNEERSKGRARRTSSNRLAQGALGTRLGKEGASGFLPLVLTRCTGEMTDLPFLVIELSGNRHRSVDAMFPHFVVTEEEEGGCRPSRSPMLRDQSTFTAAMLTSTLQHQQQQHRSQHTTTRPLQHDHDDGDETRLHNNNSNNGQGGTGSPDGGFTTTTTEGKGVWETEWGVVAHAHQIILRVVEEHRDFGVSVIRSSGYAVVIACTAPALAIKRRNRFTPYGMDEELEGARGGPRGSSSSEEASALALLTIASVIQSKLRTLGEDPMQAFGASSTLGTSHGGVATDRSFERHGTSPAGGVGGSTTSHRSSSAATASTAAVQEQLEQFTAVGMSPARAPNSDGRAGGDDRNTSQRRRREQPSTNTQPSTTNTEPPLFAFDREVVGGPTPLTSLPPTPSRHQQALQQQQLHHAPPFFTHRMIMNVSPLLPAVLGSGGAGSAVFFDFFGPGMAASLKVLKEVGWGSLYATERSIGPAIIYLMPVNKWSEEMNAAIQRLHHQQPQHQQPPGTNGISRSQHVTTLASTTATVAASSSSLQTSSMGRTAVSQGAAQEEEEVLQQSSQEILLWRGVLVPHRLQHTFRWIEQLLHAPTSRYISRDGVVVDTIAAETLLSDRNGTTPFLPPVVESMLDLECPMVRHYLGYNERIRFSDGLDAELFWHMNDDDDDLTTSGEEDYEFDGQRRGGGGNREPKRIKSSSYGARIGQRAMFKVRGVEILSMRRIELSTEGGGSHQ
ncbi:transmembrane protein, putative [Bodo saltans]|uniref:Transmembrane protein, putative n=1 Tax=Bodo saltans TaxID=75058 RepID=A0A0S4JYB6_BODSA|nr:transmembrane protein, putative [Bodo saltans]|eukprot:CUG93591.1 transmembrane protein, putative [Bodo saltans]